MAGVAVSAGVGAGDTASAGVGAGDAAPTSAAGPRVGAGDAAMQHQHLIQQQVIFSKLIFYFILLRLSLNAMPGLSTVYYRYVQCHVSL